MSDTVCNLQKKKLFKHKVAINCIDTRDRRIVQKTDSPIVDTIGQNNRPMR